MSEDFDWSGVVDYAKRNPVQPPVTQYELPGVTEEDHQGVPVAVVPLWHAMVTARLTVPAGDHAALRAAQARLAAALDEIETVYPIGPSGLFIQVGYGTRYFRDRIPGKLTDEYMPKSALAGTEGQWALIDSIRFPKDPDGLVLEDHDVVFHFKSDFREHIENVISVLFTPDEQLLNGIPAEHAHVGDLMTVTTIRRGFAGHGLPKKIGMRMGIPGAELVPDGAMLFMGFSSSHVHGLAQGNLPSFETLPGYTDVRPGDYFAGGTAMHISRIGIKLDKWYEQSHRERLQRAFQANRTESEEVLSPTQAPESATFEAERDEHTRKYHVVGHNEQMQFMSRVKEDTTTAYGDALPKGTVFFLRQDFDTVENPFSYSAQERLSARPHAAVHFVGFGPSAQHFERMRLEMDGVEHQKQFELPDENVGFTNFLETSHRQNLLLPPRAHRALPLAEML